MIFILYPKELKLSSRKQYKYTKGPQGRVVLSSTLPVVSMTFDEVGVPAPPIDLADLLQPLTFQWSILYVWQYSQLLI